jgi:hypothetical protein
VIDGSFIAASPQQLVKEGKIVNVPFMTSKLRLMSAWVTVGIDFALSIGDTDDEGT